LRIATFALHFLISYLSRKEKQRYLTGMESYILMNFKGNYGSMGVLDKLHNTYRDFRKVKKPKGQ